MNSNRTNSELPNLNVQRRISRACQIPSLRNSKFRFGSSAFNPRSRRAFTLVEMLLVLVILAVLAAIVIPRLSGRGEQAKIAAAKTDIGTFKTALGIFEADNQFYPQSSVGLNALIEQPSNAKDWKGPYIDKRTIPMDPWGNAYLYSYPSKNNPRGFEITSMGPDGRAGGDDDITSQ